MITCPAASPGYRLGEPALEIAVTAPSHLPEQPAPASAGADLARDVALRLERWYQQRGLSLPAETQAGFVEMGVEAVVRHPARPRDEVLDELVGELDASLARIHDDARAAAPASAPPRPGLLKRLFGRH